MVSMQQEPAGCRIEEDRDQETLAALDDIVTGTGVPGRLVVPTPSGVPFTQATAARYAGEDRLIFACGRYEGIDARVVDHMRQHMPVDETSVGDYVLAGGEAAVLVMIEAVGRLLPGVLGNAGSAACAAATEANGGLVGALSVFGGGRVANGALFGGWIE